MIYIIENGSVWGTKILYSLALSSVKIFLLTAFVLFLLKVFRVKNPRTQHLAWVIVLCGMLVLPIASFFITPPISLAILPDISKQTGPHQPELSIKKQPEDKRINSPNDLNSASNQPAAEVPEDEDSKENNLESLNTQSSFTRLISSFNLESLKTFLPAAYFFGLFVSLWRFARSMLKTRRLLQNCKPINNELITQLCERLSQRMIFRHRTTTVFTSTEILIPVTTGLFNPKILLPEDWKSWEELKIKSVLAHEMAHVRRNDYLFLLLATFNKCVNWFNPLSWFLTKRIAELAEIASDNSAICFMKDSNRYAKYLLELAAKTGVKIRRPGIKGVAMAQSSQVISRINLILQTENDFSKENRYLTGLTLVFCFSALFIVLVLGLQLSAPKSKDVLAADNLEVKLNQLNVTPIEPSNENLASNTFNTITNQPSDIKPEYKSEQKQVSGIVSTDEVQSEQQVQANPPELQNKGIETKLPPNQPVPVPQSQPGIETNIFKNPQLTVSDGDKKKAKEASIPEPAENKNDNPVEGLISALKDNNPVVRQQAAEALKLRRDKRAVQPLILALNDSNANVRQSAAETLGAIGDSRAVAPLITTLKDGNSRVRQMSSKALGDIGNNQAVAPLQELSGDNNQFVRKEAENSLRKLTKNK